MTPNLMNTHAVDTALQAMSARFAVCVGAAHPSDPTIATTVQNIAKTTQAALAAGRRSLMNGETETALYCLACANGAVSLINALLANPTDQIIEVLAAPFKPNAAQVTQ